MSERAAVYIPVVYVIEEKPKIFDLIKNILKTNGGEKNIFLYGGADCSRDIKEYIEENGVLIFRFAAPVLLPEIKNNRIDLAVLGECKNPVRCGNIKSVLLNTDNSCGLKYLSQNAQIITCGLKEKDTVIFSSINLDEGNVILDLQRSVKNIKCEMLEPFEKKINIPENIKCRIFTAEDLILAFTALMLCGKL